MSQSCGENYPDAIARRDVPVLSGAERERGALLYISIDIIIFVNGLGRLSLLRDTSRARCLARNGDDGSYKSFPSPLFWSSFSLEIGPGIIQCDPWTRTRSRLARNIIHHRFFLRVRGGARRLPIRRLRSEGRTPRHRGHHHHETITRARARAPLFHLSGDDGKEDRMRGHLSALFFFSGGRDAGCA